jgi:hypothetical protein
MKARKSSSNLIKIQEATGKKPNALLVAILQGKNQRCESAT